MKPLEPFEWTPELQATPADPIVLTLQPLDFRGYMNMTGASALGLENTDVVATVTARYIVGWRGGGETPPASKAEAERRLAEILSGPPNAKWMAIILGAGRQLQRTATLSETEEKKS